MSLERRLRELDPSMRRPEDGPEPPWKRVERERLEKQFTAAAMRQLEDTRRVEGLPDSLRERLSEDMHETPSTVALEAPAALVVLSGGVGCGKSLAAAAWLLAGQLEGVRGLWMTAARLARWPRYDEDRMSELLTVRRLVIDDLGDEYLDEKGAYLSLLDEVVNERYGNARPTVLTTNLNAVAFKIRYGPRIADRIREAGKFESVDGPSLRKRRD